MTSHVQSISLNPSHVEGTNNKTMSGALSVKAHCLPFSQIPHTTRLFTDYLAYAPRVQAFYSRSPYLAEWVKEEGASIRYDSDRRECIADILERQNKSWKASAETLSNIDRLRKGAAAVVTGQQVGLFGGPTFSLYKALTAVKLAEEATAAGVEAVPVFWLATYDHDLAEVNHVALPGAEGALQTLTTSSHDLAGAPVSAVRLGEEILPVVEQAATLLGDSEATNLLRETYRPGGTLGSAFARLFSRLFADWGVIVLDASDPELHRLAEPIYTAAIERAAELAGAVLKRGDALDAAGYHQQVKVALSSVLLFTLQNGARTPIHQQGQGESAEFVIGGEVGSEKISKAELLRRLHASPENFSPNVLLRPIVEDYLLPTLAYTGGAAETAYFAQSAPVYELLAGRITPIIPRFSATIVEQKPQRVLEKLEMTVPDIFAGTEGLRQKIATKYLPGDLQAAFETTKKSLETNLAEVKERLAKLDPTLADAAQTAGSKMQHQIEKLQAQAARAEGQKGDLIQRKAEMLTNALYPEKGLQERTIGGAYFMAKYGHDLLQQLHDAIHTDCHDHQIIEL
jgi:bacillithiol biosynthesis cysteine-adding enzyme BshC